jgi:hypothetical protein
VEQTCLTFKKDKKQEISFLAQDMMKVWRRKWRLIPCASAPFLERFPTQNSSLYLALAQQQKAANAAVGGLSQFQDYFAP